MELGRCAWSCYRSVKDYSGGMQTQGIWQGIEQGVLPLVSFL